MKIRLFISHLVALILTLSAASSAWNQADPCGSDVVHQHALATNTDYVRNFEAVQEAVLMLQSSSSRSTDIYNIPVVVHVMHIGSMIGENENISDEQIYSAIEGLNNDFRKVPGTFGDGSGVDTFIQFELAKRTPNDAPTNGIVRVDASEVEGYMEDGIASANDKPGANETELKLLSVWPADQYVNIWVVSEIDGNNAGSGYQGFAYVGPTNDSNDGIVLLYNTFGLVGELKPGRDMNRTITHEMGHHLDLFHTFEGGSCSESNCETNGDQICDTPPTSKNESCTSTDCPEALLDNYMDYAPQTCKSMFTEGQKTRMHACLESVRSSLLTSLGAVPVTDQDLTVSSLTGIGSTTCLTSVQAGLIVTNNGSEDVVGFEVQTTLNDHDTFTMVYADTVPTSRSVEVSLPELSAKFGTNNLQVEISLLDGVSDQFPDNDVSQFSFDVEAQDIWNLDFNFADYALDLNWTIEDANNNVLMSGGAYENPDTGDLFNYFDVNESGCIPTGCHTLNLFDSASDGLCFLDLDEDGICDYGGEMVLRNAAGDTLAQISAGSSNFGQNISFEVCAQEAEVEGCEDIDENGICDDAELEGCRDVEACNFVPGALSEDGTCIYPPEFLNCGGQCLHDADGDGICNEFEVSGCDDVEACNYNESATDNDGSCTYAEEFVDCDGNCIRDEDFDGVCDEQEIAGCQDVEACNYSELATDEDGSCDYAEEFVDCDGNCINDADADGVCDEQEIAGCQDAEACNFSELATDDDDSCNYAEEFVDCDGNCINDADADGVCDEQEIAGCMDMGANNYNPMATDNDESCTYDEIGCMDEEACNFNAFATVDGGNCVYSEMYYTCDGSCLSDSDSDGICDELEIEGCQDEESCNYMESATDEDGSCTYPEAFYDCDGICLNDTDGDGVCDELEVDGCTDENACNYIETATEEDGSCEYPEVGMDCDGATSDIESHASIDELSVYPNPMSPEDVLIYIAGLQNDQTVIRVLTTDGRVAWQGSGIVKQPGIVGFPIREYVTPGTYYIQVGTTNPSANIPLMIW